MVRTYDDERLREPVSRKCSVHMRRHRAGVHPPGVRHHRADDAPLPLLDHLRHLSRAQRGEEGAFDLGACLHLAVRVELPGDDGVADGHA